MEDMAEPTRELRVQLSVTLHRHLRVTAAQRDLSITGAVAQAVEGWLAPERRKAPEPDQAALDQAYTKGWAQGRAVGAQEVYDLLRQGPGSRERVEAHLEAIGAHTNSSNPDTMGA